MSCEAATEPAILWVRRSRAFSVGVGGSKTRAVVIRVAGRECGVADDEFHPFSTRKLDMAQTTAFASVNQTGVASVHPATMCASRSFRGIASTT